MIKVSELLKNIFYILLIITFAQPFIGTLKRAYERTLEPHTKVGYIEINGMIADSSSYVKQFKHLFKDAEIKAVLLKIDATGGIAGSCQSIFQELMELKKEHPKQVVVWVEKVCASGAYWIACAADHIVASPVSWVGSIGAYMPFRFKLKDFINSYNIKYEAPKAGAYKNFTDPFVDTTPEQAAMIQELLNQTYHEFTQSVASRRSKLSINQVNTWANGKVFTGRQALELGLIDEVGVKSTAIAWIKEKALIEGKIDWVRPPHPSGWSSYFSSTREESEEAETSLVAQLTEAICTRLENKYFKDTNLPYI